MNVPGDWRVERNSLSIYTTTTAWRACSYTVASADVEPSPAAAPQTRRAPRGLTNGATSACRSPSSGCGTLAERITAGQGTAYGKAVALQQWFTGTRASSGTR